MTFDEILPLLKAGIPVKRERWKKTRFVFRQVPAEIPLETVPKMQSLPPTVKRLLSGRALSYRHQLALCTLAPKRAFIVTWTPAVADLEGRDWEPCSVPEDVEDGAEEGTADSAD